MRERTEHVRLLRSVHYDFFEVDADAVDVVPWSTETVRGYTLIADGGIRRHSVTGQRYLGTFAPQMLSSMAQQIEPLWQYRPVTWRATDRGWRRIFGMTRKVRALWRFSRDGD